MRLAKKIAALFVSAAMAVTAVPMGYAEEIEEAAAEATEETVVEEAGAPVFVPMGTYTGESGGENEKYYAADDEDGAEIAVSEITETEEDIDAGFSLMSTTELSGMGTEDSPYLIYTEDELIALALETFDNAYTSYYSLQSDIELTADTWTPIGAATGFSGVFDGNGYTISSTVLFQSSGMSGVFGINKGTIKNLNINVTIADVAQNAGALAAENSGTIENCYSEGTISATANVYIGGLVGVNTGTITNSGSSVVIDASSAVAGGLVGQNYNNGVIRYSYADGDVIGNYAGGLIGEQYTDASAAITMTEYSYALGKVTGGSYGGGLIGYNHRYSSRGSIYVQYCYAKGVVVAGTNNGGIFGATNTGSGVIYKYNYYNKTNDGNNYGFPVSLSNMKKQATFYGWDFGGIWEIDASKNDGYPYINLRESEELAITGTGSQTNPYIIENEEQLFAIGALKLDSAMSAYYTLANDVTVTANYWTPIGMWGDFTGVFDGNGHTISGIYIADTSYDVSGLFGYNSGTIKNLTVSDTEIVGNDYTGAVAAYNKGMIENCYTTESLLSNLSANYVGGIAGVNTGTISICGVDCDVTSDNSAIVGGLLGQNYNGGVVQYSYSMGDVTGKYAGGLIGEQYTDTAGKTATTENCYSMGKVTGSGYAGGLIGYLHRYSSRGTLYVEYCYARGLTAGTGNMGGLIGNDAGTSDDVIIRYCYYNKTNTGNKIGFSVSPSSLKKQETLYGWDFDHIWTIDSSVNSGYPSISLREGTYEITLEGSGDEDDPYLIHNEEELWALVLDSGDYLLTLKNHYQLMNDIEITATHWTPIGSNGVNAFNGVFDGNGYTISGVTLTNNYYEYIGLFGKNTGTIKNLTVSAEFEGVTFTGAVAAYNSGTIENCSSVGTVTDAGSNYVGGLVGVNIGTITQSNSSAAVGVSGNIAGGLLGQNYNGGLVQYSYATGDVTGKYAGGLIGEQYTDTSGKTATTENSYSMGKVTGSSYAGGLIGYAHRYSSRGNLYTEYCYSTSIVADSGTTGGLIGNVITSDTSISVRYSYYNSYNTGNEVGFGATIAELMSQDTFYMWNFDNIWTIDANENEGCPYISLRGKIKAHELDGYGDEDDPYMIETEEDLWALVDGTYNLESAYYYQLQNDIEITAKHWTPIGSNGIADFNGVFDGNGYTISGVRLADTRYDYIGLFGKNAGTIKNLNVSAELEGLTFSGAVAAYNSGTIQNCSSVGTVKDSGSNYTGGLVGVNAGSIIYSQSSAAVGASENIAGGLIGQNYNNGTVQYSYATGNVIGKYAGGLIGEQYTDTSGTAAMTENSYSMGKVTGSSYAGGLIGYVHRYSSRGNLYVEYSYSNGKVEGTGTLGGLIGGNSNGTVTTSYYNSTLSEQSDIDRGTPLDDDMIRLSSSFVGWDFDDIWGISSGINDGYPYLLAIAPEATVAVTGIVLDKTSLTLEKGASETLTATVTPDDATDKTVTWTSSNESVVTVKNGVVTAVGEGTAVIIAMAGSFTATCTVTVEAAEIAVTGVVLSSSSISLTEGGTATITATVTPSDATDKTLIWTSGNESVATVENGVVTAISAGTAVIAATAGSCSAVCVVTVTAKSTPTVAVTGITLSSSSLMITEGESNTLIATIAPSDATDKTVTWTSSNESVATVQNGVVTAVSVGTAVIIATAGSCMDMCTVTVTAANIDVTGVTLSDAAITITEGESTVLTATISPDNATDKSVTWTSSDTGVAAVENGVVTAVSAGTAVIVAMAGKYTAICTVTVEAKTVDVTGVSLSSSTLSLTEGDRATITATVLPTNATDKTVTWTSSDTGVATVENGVVTAVSAGTAVIVAMAGKYTAMCTVTVSSAEVAVESVTLSETTLSLTEGKSATLTATVLPSDATDKTITWQSSDTSVATVKNGVVTAVSAGTAIITAEAVGKSAMCRVSVEAAEVAVTEVTLSSTAATLTVGDKTILIATVTPTNATDASVTWETSDTGVATVENGVITAVAAGEATITATAGGYTASCTVTVTEALEATSVTLSAASLTVAVNCYKTLTATVTPSDATNADVVWTSSKTSVAKVENGKVTGVKSGTAVITATVGDVSASCTVTVKTASYVKFSSTSVTPASLSMTAGDSEKLTAAYTLSATSYGEPTVTFTSNDMSVATVSEDGTVTAIGAGETTITVVMKAYTTVTYQRTVTVTEPEYAVITVGSVESFAGGTVTVPVAIAKNPGIAGFKFRIVYDTELLEPVSIAKGSALTSGTLTSNIQQGGSMNSYNYITASWIDTVNFTDNGVILNVTFKVSSDAPDGDIPISITYEGGNILNASYEDVEIEAVSGAVSVVTALPGDVYTDGVVNQRDGVRLMQYLADTGVELTTKEKKAADVTGDGNVNTKDGVRLMQYLADWDVELMELFGIDDFKLMGSDTLTFKVDSVEGEVGEYVDVPVYITENPGVAGFKIALNYDTTKLTAVSITAGDVLSEGTLTSNLSGGDVEYITASWINTSNVTATGVAFTVRFKISDDMTGKTALTITYSGDEICDQNLDEVSVSVIEGAVTVGDAEDESDYTIESVTTEQTAEGLHVAVSVTKNASRAAADRVIIAEYADNTLVDVEIVEMSGMEQGETQSFEAVLKYVEGAEVKAFIWNENGMVPLN